ncbi:MAG: hypothetical protein KF794_13875 [Xanthobacteraceae bacterium]|nr:hypothetical protein [Xanthobacteraceae bacterium]QYK44827.1 MAG: hypothetical protein KF794_13875 [Xanthobacteraceae bacterium]HMN51701.1 hypothetical protein [Xanthobacteraceae bacterium]
MAKEAKKTEKSGGGKQKPAVIIVGADKGGVGKTTVARTLLDYFAGKNVLARAFDTESPRGTLKRFHPRNTEIVDITQVADQMKILDTLTSSEVKVTIIDVRAGLLSRVLKDLTDVGFFDAAKEGDFKFALFHVLGPSVASLSEIEEILPFTSDGDYYVVKNHINETNFFEWDQATYDRYFKKAKKTATEITVPKLNEMAYEQVEIAGVPFAAFGKNKNAKNQNADYSLVLRGYTRTWQKNVNEQYDDAGLLEWATEGAQAS